MLTGLDGKKSLLINLRSWIHGYDQLGNSAHMSGTKLILE